MFTANVQVAMVADIIEKPSMYALKVIVLLTSSEMSVDEALTVFGKQPRIAEKLQTLAEVGLGYIKLGQPATTVSGVKLSV